eukprot:Em0008g989a
MKGFIHAFEHSGSLSTHYSTKNKRADGEPEYASLVVVAATADGYNQHKGYTRTRTRPTTDGKHLLVYCPKLNPPVYRYIKESNAYYHIGSIIHYYCNYGYELYGSSWNKCVYEYGVAKWEYPVPICKPKVYSG